VRAYQTGYKNKHEEGQFDGVGFALSDNVDENGLTIAGVDLDKVDGNKEREDRFLDIIGTLRSYTEKSPSGQGYRIFLWARPLAKNVTHDGVEFYASQTRFLTVTGHVISPTTALNVAPDEFEAMVKKYGPDGEGNVKPKKSRKSKKIAEDDDVVILDAPAGNEKHQSIVSENEDLSSGAETLHWFDMLSPEDKDACLAKGISTPGFIARADQDYPEWLKIVIAIARSGAPSRRKFCHQWSKTCPKRYDEAELDKRLDEFDGTEGDITVGTLIKAMIEDGWDPGPWRAKVQPQNAVMPMTFVAANPSGPAAAGGATINDGPLDIHSLPHVITGPDVMSVLNRCLGYVHDTGKDGSYVTYDDEGRFLLRSYTSLTEAMITRRVGWTTNDGEQKEAPALQVWRKSENRREFAKLIFDPRLPPVWAKNGSGMEVLNQWRGLAVKPGGDKSKCRLMLEHLFHVVCSGNKAHFLYLIHWMAHAVQKPWEAPETMIVLRSDRGGTSTVVKWLLRIFGDHGFETQDTEHVVGRFTGHLLSKCFIVVEEQGFADKKSQAQKLEGLVTSTKIPIEDKNAKIRDVWPRTRLSRGGSG
jgi:hypothetical protein